MAAAHDTTGSDTAGSNHLDADGVRKLLKQYRDIITDYGHHAELARRFGEVVGVIEALNRGLDRRSQALYALAGPEDRLGTIYTSRGDGSGWERATDYSVQGMPRPFIGDSLIVIDDGTLLLVDTARRVGISNFYDLDVRWKEDEEVQQFSDDEAVGTVKKLGDLGRDTDTAPMLKRDRWGNTETDPPLDD